MYNNVLKFPSHWSEIIPSDFGETKNLSIFKTGKVKHLALQVSAYQKLSVWMSVGGKVGGIIGEKMNSG